MKLTKKLFIAIMTMALLVVTFTTSTFAWFTLGSTGTVEPLSVDVTTGTGMEISKDGKSWKNKIQLVDPSDITNLDFTAVTSFNGKDFYDAEDGALTGANAAANKKYYEATFYVRISKGDSSDSTKHLNGVYLTAVNATNSGTKSWVSDVTLEKEVSGVNTLTQYNSKTIEEGKTYQFDALNAAKISFAKVARDNNADVETVTKVYAYEDSTTTWGSVPAAADINNGTVEAGLAWDYADAKGYVINAAAQPGQNSFPTYLTNADIEAANAESGATTTDRDKAQVLAYDDFDNFASINVDLGAGLSGDDTNYVYAKVTIRIWLEGWDADCINAILSQETTIGFVLKAY